MLKVTLLEKFKYYGEAFPYLKIPTFLSDRSTNYSDKMHSRNVVYVFDKILHEALGGFMDDAEIKRELELTLLPRSPYGLKNSRLNGVTITGISSTELDYYFPEIDIVEENLLAEQSIMIAAVGNDGNEVIGHEEAPAASRLIWLGVGAVNDHDEPRSYSSWGNGEVFCVGYDGYEYPDDNYTMYGTSFGQPYVTAIITAYSLLHNKWLGYYPKKEQIQDWMIKHCVDVHDEGFDMKTGNGLLMIPDVWEFYDTIYDVVTKKKTIRRVQNRIYSFEDTTKLIHRDVADVENITVVGDFISNKFYHSHAI